MRVEAEDRLRDLGPSGADEPGQPEDLSGANGERDVAEAGGTAQAFDAQQLRTGRRLHMRGEVLVQPPANHQLDQRRAIE